MRYALGAAIPIDLIDRAETPALWTALTRCSDFDPIKGLPENPNRTIVVNGRHVGPTELLNFFGSPSACLKVRGGYVKLANSIHHARIYRIDGKKTTYAMVRVFQVDLRRMKHQDLFTTPLMPSSISMRTSETKIRKAIADGTATQIGWLVEGDELQLNPAMYGDGSIAKVFSWYPELTAWRVAGFKSASKIRIKPLLLSKEGFVDDKDAARLGIEPTPDEVRKAVDDPGWVTAINVLLQAGGVRVIRRNCLGEERWRSSASLPVSMMLE